MKVDYGALHFKHTVSILKKKYYVYPFEKLWI